MSPPCSHSKVFSIHGKTSDMNWFTFPDGMQAGGYVPPIPGIRGDSGEDYIDIRVCLDCKCLLDFDPEAVGKVQDSLTLPEDEEDE